MKSWERICTTILIIKTKERNLLKSKIYFEPALIVEQWGEQFV